VKSVYDLMSQERMPLTKIEILDTARKLFILKGFRNTTISEISRESGKSRVTVYSHFNTKEDILGALVQIIWDANSAVFREFGELENWSRSSISNWLDEVMQVYERDWDFARLVWLEFPALGAEAMPHIDLWVKAMTANTKLWMRFKKEERENRAYLLIFQLNYALSAWQGLGWSRDRKSLHRTLLNVWLETLGEKNTAAPNLK